MKFLNQIRGISTNATGIHFTTRNKIDQGILCSVLGPDVFVVCPPRQFQALGSSIDFIKKNEHLQPVFSRNVHGNKVDVRKKVRMNMGEDGVLDQYVVKWNLPPCVVCTSSDVGLFVIITDSQNDPISKFDST